MHVFDSFIIYKWKINSSKNNCVIYNMCDLNGLKGIVVSMKKKTKIIILIIICLIISLIFYGTYQKNKAKERYSEIKENVKKGVEWNITARHPFCSLTTSPNEKQHIIEAGHLSDLVNEGYIKKEELLDIDNKSYCDVFVEIYKYKDLQNSLDYNCEVSYKIYLKCKNYEDEGYKNK